MLIVSFGLDMRLEDGASLAGVKPLIGIAVFSDGEHGGNALRDALRDALCFVTAVGSAPPAERPSTLSCRSVSGSRGQAVDFDGVGSALFVALMWSNSAKHLT